MLLVWSAGVGLVEIVVGLFSVPVLVGRLSVCVSACSERFENVESSREPLERVLKILVSPVPQLWHPQMKYKSKFISGTDSERLGNVRQASWTRPGGILRRQNRILQGSRKTALAMFSL